MGAPIWPPQPLRSERPGISRGAPTQSPQLLDSAHFDEASTIGPVGAGTPPAGSIVTANTPRVPPRRGSTRTPPAPLASTAKSPAGRGVLPLIVHSS